jgi:hypothetical protein
LAALGLVAVVLAGGALVLVALPLVLIALAVWLVAKLLVVGSAVAA